MASVALGPRVRSCYRLLLRARGDAFAGDGVALAASRKLIREQFQKNAGERNQEKITKLVDEGEQAARVLREQVVQAQMKQTGVYELKLRKTTRLEKNVPFKAGAGCCGGAGANVTVPSTPSPCSTSNKQGCA
eukprot:Opistho-2@77248